MDMWSAKKRAIFLTIIGVVMIALIAVPIAIIRLKSVPDIEEFLKVNNLERVISEFGCVMITQIDAMTYIEETDGYLNYSYGISSDEISQMYYVVNGRAFMETDGSIYYDYHFNEKTQGLDSSLDAFLGFENIISNAYDDSTIKKKDGKYFLTFEKENGYDSNTTVYELYFNKNLYLDKIRYISAGNIAEQKFTYGKKIEYPEYINNYDSGDRVTVTVINLLANETEEFELKKGSLFRMIYGKAVNPYELYIDEACTMVYGTGLLSTASVDEDITIYIGYKFTR